MADWTKLISLIVLLWLFGSFDNVDYFFFLGSSEFGCRLKRMKISVYIFEDQTKKISKNWFWGEVVGIVICLD